MIFQLKYPKLIKKIPGLFKDEFSGVPIREFVGLRSKMYAFRTDVTDKKVCKGIKKANVERMKFDNYKDCLFNTTQTIEQIYGILSENLQLYTIMENKVGLSPYDDKKYLLDKFTRLSHGHY